MTVEELKEILEKLPPAAKVEILASYDCGYCMAGGDIISTSFEEDTNCLVLINDERGEKSQTNH